MLLLSIFFFFFNDTATTEIYTLSLHDALPIYQAGHDRPAYEDFGDAHDVFSGDLVLTLEPGVTREAPSTTTVSPGLSPPATTVSAPSVRATCTGRSSTLKSSLTT